MIHKPSLGSCDVPQKNWTHQFSSFDVYWIQRNRQTDRQATFIYRLQLALAIYSSLYLGTPLLFIELGVISQTVSLENDQTLTEAFCKYKLPS